MDCQTDPGIKRIGNMETMHVDQAVFASSDRGSVKGYQLISKSTGIDRACSRVLSRWAPTRVLSEDLDQWTLNHFPVSNDLFAVTRTVFGGPEYSGRGGTQIVTLFLLLNHAQFKLYDFNPISVARTAIAMGWLRLPLETKHEQLPQATLPIRPIAANASSDDHTEAELLEDISSHLVRDRRVAVIGVADPIGAVGRLVPRLSEESRKKFSFTTGLAPSNNRRFQAHFFSSTTMHRERTLNLRDLVCIHAS